MHSLLVAIAISFSDALLKNAVDLYMEHTWGLFSKLCFVEYAGPASKTSSFEKCEEQSRIFGVVHSVILTLLTDLRPQVNRASVKLLKFWFTESIKLRNSTEHGNYTFSLIISGFLKQWVEYCTCTSELQVGRVGNVTVRMAAVRVLQEFFSVVPFEYLLMDIYPH